MRAADGVENIPESGRDHFSVCRVGIHLQGSAGKRGTPDPTHFCSRPNTAHLENFPGGRVTSDVILYDSVIDP